MRTETDQSVQKIVTREHQEYVADGGQQPTDDDAPAIAELGRGSDKDMPTTSTVVSGLAIQWTHCAPR